MSKSRRELRESGKDQADCQRVGEDAELLDKRRPAGTGAEAACGCAEVEQI
jgi:hypothetical protein